MHRLRQWITVFVFAAGAFAQVTIPGTFSTVPAEASSSNAPITSPAIISLGNGLSPAVVTNQQNGVVIAPENQALELGGGTVGLPSPAAATASGASVANASPATSNQEPSPSSPGSSAQQPAFDFSVAPGNYATGGEGDGRSLGEIAQAVRRDRASNGMAAAQGTAGESPAESGQPASSAAQSQTESREVASGAEVNRSNPTSNAAQAAPSSSSGRNAQENTASGLPQASTYLPTIAAVGLVGLVTGLLMRRSKKQV